MMASRARGSRDHRTAQARARNMPPRHVVRETLRRVTATVAASDGVLVALESVAEMLLERRS